MEAGLQSLNGPSTSDDRNCALIVYPLQCRPAREASIQNAPKIIPADNHVVLTNGNFVRLCFPTR